MKLKTPRRVIVFNNKFPLVGPIVWVLSVQYFLFQLVATLSWDPPYDWKNHLISDLGNTECGQYAGRYVCSPDNFIMNGSFIMLGFTMALGSLLIYQSFKRNQASLVGFSMMALAGFGTFLVGLFPENTISELHAIGAFLALFVGNLSLVVLALALHRVRPSFRIYTFLSGTVSTVAFILFVTDNNLGLGPGGMERVVSYPQTLWLILFGIYMTRSRYRAIKQN
ncbi:MAG TPA: DUF998 domain-containing protein [Candidatus Saccharimonadales bacterium]|nr:DUF998 domain-containing protein [Candidatus Saccharimonadales bacterium]